MLTLVLGGVRSGKSAAAEARIAAAAGDTPVRYLATGSADDLGDRVAAHRDRRPAHWRTEEVGTHDLIDALADPGPVLLDSIGTWVARHLDLDPDIDALVEAVERRVHPTVIVSEEVGLGVHAPTEVGRRFADVLGTCNQRLGAVVDTVVLVVAGRELEL